MKNARFLDWLVIGARVTLAGLFLFAAATKLASPRDFAEAIANYHLVPDWLSSITASVLPIMEIVVACALVAGVKERGAALVAAAMLIIFAIAMISTVSRGIDLDCGCFGAAAEAQVGWGTIARNLVLTLVAIGIAVRPHVAWKRT
ncbi:MAG: DoxX family membrane protein [Sandaracinaceae bacterium]|nr:DoxX family membrane protein [Sandaracinaceae bacterium]